MRCEIVVVLCALTTCLAEYQNVLHKLWLKDIVTSAPDNKVGTHVPRYGFKPRAIPLEVSDDRRNKSEILYPGSYVPIAEATGSEGGFRPRAIPLIRSEFEGRSLDSFEEPIIEKPEEEEEEFTEGQRRSISDILGDEEDEEEEAEEEDGEYEVEDVDGLERKKNKLKIKKPKVKKLKKYMLPLLLAYKLKYFALVPVMVAGLLLLIGATGLAGFFFALFAAVMGLQKGGY